MGDANELDLPRTSVPPVDSDAAGVSDGDTAAEEEGDGVSTGV
jgi:hypothetical protein